MQLWFCDKRFCQFENGVIAKSSVSQNKRCVVGGIFICVN